MYPTMHWTNWVMNCSSRWGSSWSSLFSETLALRGIAFFLWMGSAVEFPILFTLEVTGESFDTQQRVGIILWQQALRILPVISSYFAVYFEIPIILWLCSFPLEDLEVIAFVGRGYSIQVWFFQTFLAERDQRRRPLLSFRPNQIWPSARNSTCASWAHCSSLEVYLYPFKSLAAR